MLALTVVLSLNLAFAQCFPHARIDSLEGHSKRNVRRRRVLGGSESTFGQHPWQVAIFRKDSDYSRVHCGGSLIDEKHVLTAAHCTHDVPPDSIIARLGEHDLADSSEEAPYVEYDVRRVITHDNYDFEESNIADDIALLELAEPVVFRDHIAPISLPQPGADFAGEEATVYGWGRIDRERRVSNTLKRIDVQVVDGDTCKKWLIAHRLGELRGSFLCAGFARQGYGPCKGDSGGPMILKENGRLQVIGVISGSFGCGKPDSPVFYTEVSKYVEWILGRIHTTARARGNVDIDGSVIDRINRTIGRKNLKTIIVLMMGIILSICIFLVFPK